MVGNNHHSSSISALIGRVGRLAARGLQTRVELLAVEWQEERLRLADLLMRALTLGLLAIMGAMLLTATIIFLFPEGARVYVTGVLAILYIFGAVGAWSALKTRLKQEPFAESVEQLKKDRLWVESLK